MVMNKTITIIIEWENVILSADDRALIMLSELSSQIDAVLEEGCLTSLLEPFLNDELTISLNSDDKPKASPIEIIVFADPRRIIFEDVKNILKVQLTQIIDKVSIRLFEAHDIHYYDIKNLGALVAKGDYCLFLDSDVIPQPNWLKNYIYALEQNPTIEVVGGNAYIDLTDVYHKTFALTWFFDLQKNNNDLYHFQNFKANNFVIRRSTLLENPFPSGTKMYRSQCSLLCENLSGDGIKVYKTNGSEVSHPAPNGLRHFFQRAICQGHDIVQSRIYRQKRRISVLMYLKLVRRMLSALKQLTINHRLVKLDLFQIPVALFIAWTYQLFVILGTVLAVISPEFVRRNFQI